MCNITYFTSALNKMNKFLYKALSYTRCRKWAVRILGPKTIKMGEETLLNKFQVMLEDILLVTVLKN